GECRLLDDLVCPRQQRGWDRQSERLGRLEVDDQLELRRLLHWEVGRFGSPENAVDIRGSASRKILAVATVGHEPANLDEESRWKDCRQPLLGREGDDPAHARREGTDRQDPEGAWTFLHHPCKGRLDIIWALGRYRGERQAKPSRLTLHLRLTDGSEAGESRVP